MSKNIYLQILSETIPLLIGIALTCLFWQNNLLLLILYILITLIVLKIKYYPGDIQAFIYGLLVGLLIETFGTSVAGYQSFTNPDFLGIPIWLPVAWGYGLMIMKRIGIIIYQARS